MSGPWTCKISYFSDPVSLLQAYNVVLHRFKSYRVKLLQRKQMLSETSTRVFHEISWDGVHTLCVYRDVLISWYAWFKWSGCQSKASTILQEKDMRVCDIALVEMVVCMHPTSNPRARIKPVHLSAASCLQTVLVGATWSPWFQSFTLIVCVGTVCAQA